MLFRNRPDGRLARVPSYTRLLPVLMPTRTESAIYMEQLIEVDAALEFIDQWNQTLPDGRRKLTLMQLLLTAFARTVALRPRLNRFVAAWRHYQRNNISVTFVAKKTLDDDGKEVNVTMPFRPGDTLDDVNLRFSEYVDRAKSDRGTRADADADFFGKLPVFVLRLVVSALRFLDNHSLIWPGFLKILPLYSTAFLTNVGSLGMDAPIHHNFELGTTGIFIALGLIRPEVYAAADGTFKERKVVKLIYSFDDRIVDGIYSGRAMELVRAFILEPSRLTEAPDLSPELLEELALTEKGWKLWAME
jgi:hypothetical protein